jgi:hypothetical protein
VWVDHTGGLGRTILGRSGAALALWLHPLSRSKEDTVPFLKELAAAGFVAVGFDAWQHGERATESGDQILERVFGGFRRHMWPILARPRSTRFGLSTALSPSSGRTRGGRWRRVWRLSGGGLRLGTHFPRSVVTGIERNLPAQGRFRHRHPDPTSFWKEKVSIARFGDRVSLYDTDPSLGARTA